MALFCATFLRPEMHHVHRQIAGLRSFDPLVLTAKREGEWEVGRIAVIPRSPFRFVGRGIERWTGRPWQIGSGESAGLLREVRGARAVLAHIFFGNVAVHMLPFFRRLKVPVVVSFHGSDVAGGMATRGYDACRREMFERVRLVLCRTSQLGEKVVALGCDPEKIRIMRTVLPPVPFVRRTPPPAGDWRLVQAARLVPKKGIATSLRAFAVFLRSHPRATFTIAGEGPLEGDLREEAQQLGISGQVEFAGFLSQNSLARLYRESHIFLHPSETVMGDVEGIPNSLLEAMASGLPAVATSHGGIPEVVRDGQTGLLCPEGGCQEVAEALLRLAADPSLASALARSGADLVAEEFGAERQIAALEAHYREAIS